MGFQNSRYCQMLFERQIPKALKELNRIANALEKIANKNEANILDNEYEKYLKGEIPDPRD